MSKKIKIVKKVIGLAIVCSLILLVFYQGAQVNVQAYTNDNGDIVKPTKFKTFNEYVSYLKKLELGSMVDDTQILDETTSVPTDNASKEDSLSVSNIAPEDFDTTNTQVAGVDEADIIKNDGKFIYILNKNNNTVKIINPKPVESMSEAGQIYLQKPNDKNYRNYDDMYLCGNKLVIIYSYNIYQDYSPIMPLDINGGERIITDCYYRPGKSFVGAEIYDVSNKAKPKLIRTVMNEGTLNSSRMVGNTLYLISNKFLDLYIHNGSNPYTKENLLVAYSDSKTSEQIKYAPVDSMYCILDKNNPYNMQNLSIISAIDIANDSELKISSFTGTACNLYMSLNNIYIFGQSWDNNGNYTDIYKYKIDGTSVSFLSCNKAKGYMLNQFCADEYNNNLRLATTDWNTGNNIYIFDKDMQKIGQITELAKGEQIKSCRFLDDKGYVVTYRTMDPLFVLDLSKPSNPVVSGELKIPGFSSYLHPVAKNLIIGIGESTTPLYWRDENGKEIESGVKQVGVKISLFDVSIPSNPIELKSMTVGGPGSSTDIGYDHKAFTIIKDKNLIAIRGIFTPKPVNGIESYEYKQQALLVSYKANSLQVEKVFDGNYSYETGNRITFIGDILYHFTGSDMDAYNFNNYTKIGSFQYN